MGAFVWAISGERVSGGNGYDSTITTMIMITIMSTIIITTINITTLLTISISFWGGVRQSCLLSVGRFLHMLGILVAPLVSRVAVKELRLSYHNLGMCRVYRGHIGYVVELSYRNWVLGI